MSQRILQSTWVSTPAPQPGAHLRLLCFPYAGGGASIYSSWAAQLAPDIELCAVRLPGREGRFAEPPLRRMDQMLTPLVAGMLLYLHRGFALFGHSLGALVAFELARELRRRGLPSPMHVFVSGRRAPHAVDPRDPDDRALYALPDAELIAELRQLGRPPGEVDAPSELLDLLLPTVRADIELAETYEYREEEPLACPITAFGGLEDDAVGEDGIAAWQAHTRCRFALHMLPGDHFFLYAMAASILAAVAQDLAVGSILGFTLDGELYIAGRLKDVIIIRGRNLYPQDLEATAAESHPALRLGCAIAFTIDVDGDERLALVQEVDPRRAADLGDVVAAIRRAVTEQHGVQPHAIALLSPGTLPKTTSGKVQRSAARQALLEQTLSPLAMWQGPAPAPNADAPPQAAAPEEAAAVAEPTPALEPTAVAEPAAVLDRRTVHQLLVAALAEATGLAPGQIDPARPFAEYGVDSASAVRIVGDLERRLARALPVTLLWDYPNITELAAHLAHPRAAGEPAVPGPAASAGLAEPIAIIGIGCRFPGASGPRRLWQLLLDGVSAISEVPAERWTVAADAAGEPTARWGGFVDDIDRFDAGFFGISPREATRMDPQQRMLLEVA